MAQKNTRVASTNVFAGNLRMEVWNCCAWAYDYAWPLTHRWENSTEEEIESDLAWWLLCAAHSARTSCRDDMPGSLIGLEDCFMDVLLDEQARRFFMAYVRHIVGHGQVDRHVPEREGREGA